MALFKLRKGREETAVPAQPPQTVEAMRRRAIHRLIGAAVLVLAGVIGFPLFFDNQPRPIPVDLPIVIPDKGKVPALVAPAPPAVANAGAAPAASAPAAQAPAKPAESAPKPAAAVEPPTKPAVAAVEPAAQAPAPAKPAIAAPDPSAAKAADAGKARDLLDGKTPLAKPAATEGRFIVQVGAFSDAEKVREVRRKVEGLGVKTYTQVVDTKDGSRIRVRIGPFTDKAEATRLAEKIRKLDLSAAILSL